MQVSSDTVKYQGHHTVVVGPQPALVHSILEEKGSQVYQYVDCQFSTPEITTST